MGRSAIQRVPITIPNGVAVPAGDTGLELENLGAYPVAILMPAAWTAADLTFSLSEDGGTTWQDVYDDLGNEVRLTVAAGRCIVLTPASDWLGVSHGRLRPRSGTAGAAVNQGADRELVFLVRHEG